MAKNEKMDRFNSKIASAAEKSKLKEIGSRKVRPSRDNAMAEILQAGDEAYDEVRRETRGAVPKNPFKKGGSVNENKMMKKMGRGLTKAAMQKVASKVVKGHEKRMHGMKSGGSVSASKRADGIAMKGKTKGRMV